MAETWQSGPSPASDIDFGANFTKATLIPNTKWMLGVQSGPCGGRKWPKLGHLDNLQAQISILGLFFEATLITNKNGCFEFSLDHLTFQTTWVPKSD